MTSELEQLPPAKRFSNRVENYVNFRPSYPEAIVPFLETVLGLQHHHAIADIGSGTGLFAEPLLKKGFTVTCIEPNPEMRAAGEKKLAGYKGFTSVQEMAENTGLPDAYADLITVAQAFHWMDADAAKKEFERIIKPGGHVVLAWNIRRTNTPFLKAFHALKQQYMEKDGSRNRSDEETLAKFFHPNEMQVTDFENMQWLDFDSLKGQLLSTSYIPLPGHSSYETMISTLIQLFVKYNENGFVKIEYDTKLYWAKY